MQRNFSLFFGGLVLLVVIAIFSTNRGSSASLSLSPVDGIPTSGILGTTGTPEVLNTSTATIVPTRTVTITPSLSPTPTKSVTPTPSLTTPTPTPTALPTCSGFASKMKIRATEFMNTHKSRDAYDVLALISEPNGTEEQQELDFWLGTGDENAGGLYQTASTSYITTKFTIGAVSDRGDDPKNRGNRWCQITVSEEREKKETDQSTTKDSYARYIDFTLAPDGSYTLTAFRSTKDGTKYSGFN